MVLVLLRLSVSDLFIYYNRKKKRTFCFSQNEYIKQRGIASDATSTAASCARIGSRLRHVNVAQFEDGHAKLRGIDELNFRVHINAFGFVQIGTIWALPRNGRR